MKSRDTVFMLKIFFELVSDLQKCRQDRLKTLVFSSSGWVIS